MMAPPVLQRAAGPKTSDLEVEIVERKGLSHPDTLCDSIMEQVAQALARMYLERTGAVRHFNCDKALLVAGDVNHRWGGGAGGGAVGPPIGGRAGAAREGGGGGKFQVGQGAAGRGRREPRGGRRRGRRADAPHHG